jgi:hypothetical protein
MASIIPDAFAAFASVETYGFAAADVEKFEDQARSNCSALRATALHGFGFTLQRIFPCIRRHREISLASESIRTKLERESTIWR